MITFLALLQIALCGLVLILIRFNRRQAVAQAREEERNASSRQDLLFAKRNRILKLLAEDTGADYAVGLKVGDLMSSFVSTVPPTETVATVREQMQKLKLRHLLVVDSDERLVGVISDRDLNKPGCRTAQDLMTAQPMTVTPEMLVSPAITTLITKHISSLPVVEGHKLVGVLTRTDLMLSLQCILQALQRASAGHAAAAPTFDSEETPVLA